MIREVVAGSRASCSCAREIVVDCPKPSGHFMGEGEGAGRLPSPPGIPLPPSGMPRVGGAASSAVQRSGSTSGFSVVSGTLFHGRWADIFNNFVLGCTEPSP